MVISTTRAGCESVCCQCFRCMAITSAFLGAVFFIASFFVIEEVTEEVTEELLGFEFEFETEWVVLACILVFGTFWCGWFCPFGNVQYFASMIGRKFLPKFQVNIPENYDRPLRWLKFGFLAMFIFVFVSKGK